MEGQYRRLVELAHYYGLPTEAAIQVHELREGVIQHVDGFASDARFDDVTRRTMLDQVQAEATKVVRESLGAEAYGKYSRTADGRWVRSYGASFRQRRMTDFDQVFTRDGLLKSMSVMITFGDVHPGYLTGLRYLLAEPDLFAGFPAYWHNGAGALAFADGHVERHRWLDPRTRRNLEERVRYDSTGTAIPIPSPGNPDARWLYDHSSGGVGFGIQDWDIYQQSGGKSSHGSP